jgi:hypothetical protein
LSYSKTSARRWQKASKGGYFTRFDFVYGGKPLEQMAQKKEKTHPTLLLMNPSGGFLGSINHQH